MGTKKRHYMFDWDDNILHMPTKIILDKKVEVRPIKNNTNPTAISLRSKWVPINVSSSQFSKIRNFIGKTYRIRPDSFSNFINDKSFIVDTLYAINNNDFGPSFKKFKECLIYGNDFAIISARSHPADTIKKSVKLIITKIFTKLEVAQMRVNLNGESINSYLNRQEYHGVSGSEFKKRFNIDSNTINPEEGKKIAIKDYVKTIVNAARQLVGDGDVQKISVGFSDDDLGNIKSVEKLIKDTLSKVYPHVNFVVYDTSDKDNINKKRIVIGK